MRCIRPIKAGYGVTGDIVYSSKKMTKELASFEFECRKCLPCRLNNAREKAIRCLHESRMHPDSIFLTLTYNEQSLKSDRLQIHDIQQFMDTLRQNVVRGIKDKDLKEKLKISCMYTGEYGDKNKRPHWHVILFNYRPADSKYLRTTDRGERVFTSDLLTKLWGKGNIEFGSVTIDSANYVARYAAKKLVHGRDAEHDYHPVHKTSSKNAIGKRWIEKHWKRTFSLGFINLPNGSKAKIPRYYVDWLKKNHPDEWIRYVTEVRPKIMLDAEDKQKKDEMEYLSDLMSYSGGTTMPLKKQDVKLTILKQKFKRLQSQLKL